MRGCWRWSAKCKPQSTEEMSVAACCRGKKVLLCIWDNGFGKTKPTRNKEYPKMLPRNHPDRIQIAFDDHRLVNNAGLILPATLALHLGLPQLVDRDLDLGDAPGRAHPGDIGCLVKAPSTLGTFLFRS